MELLLDVLLICVNSQIKLYFKNPMLIFFMFVLSQSISFFSFSFDIIHTQSFYFNISMNGVVL